MPVEMRRLNQECPQCKNSTIFDIGKSYFCINCMKGWEKPENKESIEPQASEVMMDPDKCLIQTVASNPDLGK